MQAEEEDLEIYQDDLIIPIYIDTNALLDLLASVERGFSVVEKITSRDTQTRSSDQSIKASGGTEFGIPNILNLIKVNLNGSSHRKKGNNISQESVSDRYHTYGSLLQRLRLTLIDQGLVKSFDGSVETWNKIEPYDFIELQGKFRLNPLIESFSTIERMMSLFETFARIQSPSNTKGKKSPQIQLVAPSDQPNPFGQIPLNQVKPMRDWIQEMLEELEKKDIRTIVVDLHKSTKYKAIVYLFTEYLRDQSMTEIRYKQYKLLGKVVDKLSDPKDAIDLLQGTAFSGLDDTSVSQLIQALNQPSTGISLPRAETRIPAPVIQIIPIAIYI